MSKLNCSGKGIEKIISLHFFFSFLQVFSKKSNVTNLVTIYRVLLTFKLILRIMSFFSNHKTNLECSVGDKVSFTKPRIKIMG